MHCFWLTALNKPGAWRGQIRQLTVVIDDLRPATASRSGRRSAGEVRYPTNRAGMAMRRKTLSLMTNLCDRRSSIIARSTPGVARCINLGH